MYAYIYIYIYTEVRRQREDPLGAGEADGGAAGRADVVGARGGLLGSRARSIERGICVYV